MSSTTRIFGTDGVRGTANIEPVTAETALKLGRAAAHIFAEMSATRRRNGRTTIVIGKDTRLSGYMLENALAAGVMSLGADVLLIGPLPTPGVAYQSAPCILRELGAEVVVAHDKPNGRNINRECGSTYPEEIQRLMRETKADVGISHDGDADRVLLCDEKGEVVDGDEIMAIASIDLLRAGRLEQNTVVATVMSNFGLDETLAMEAGKVVRTKVGDRYVIEEMMKQKLNLGGEQSGHIIFRDFTTTGDGIISALQILRIMHQTGQPLSKLKTCLEKYPQAQRNVLVKEKPPLAELPTVMKLVDV